MPWLRLDATFARHRKIRRLAEILDIPVYSARGLVAGLLCKVCAEQPDGCLDDWNAADIAWACDWDGDSVELRQALIAVRFIVETDDTTEINDWMEYAAGYREAERARKYRERKKAKAQSASVTHAYVTRHARVQDPPVTRHADRTGPDQTRPTCTVELGPKPKNVKQQEPRASSPADAVDRSPKIARDETNEVWQHYRTHHPRVPEVLKPNRKEYRLIRQRLEDFTVDELKAAIDGYHRSPFHCGENDRQTKYLSLELIMRDVSKVQAGLELGDRGNGSRQRALVDSTEPDSGIRDSNERASDEFQIN